MIEINGVKLFDWVLAGFGLNKGSYVWSGLGQRHDPFCRAWFLSLSEMQYNFEVMLSHEGPNPTEV